MFLIEVRQEVNNLVSYVVIQELKLAINLAFLILFNTGYMDLHGLNMLVDQCILPVRLG